MSAFHHDRVEQGGRRRRRIARRLLRLVCSREPLVPNYDDERFRKRFLEYDVESTRRFFARLGDRVDVAGKSVLDVGCGRGAVPVEASWRGASRVVGVDLAIAPQLRELVAGEPVLSEKIELVETRGDLSELGDETFDVVLSKDSFEHYAEPEAFVHAIAAHVSPGGLLAIGFGPLWLSPTGGHIEFMTRLPWAHLLFPEDVIMEARRDYRPAEPARTFAEVRGGLNRMTLARFVSIMGSIGFERLSFRTNVSDNPVVRAMGIVAKAPPLRELFTTNVYGVWRCPRRA